MKEALQRAIDRLPDVLVSYAPSMMRRIVIAMQEQITRGGQLGNPSYSNLLVKTAEPDLVREFNAAINEAMQSIKARSAANGPIDTGPAVLLELFDEESASSIADLATSTDRFAALRSKARKLGATGIDRYAKDVFLKALNAAFAKARIDPEEMTDLMPYARRALNAELLKVYGKLDDLVQEQPQAR